MTDRILYSRKQAAEELSLSVSSIDQLIRGNVIAFRRQGRRVLIPRTEIDRFARSDHYKIWPPKQNGKTTRVMRAPLPEAKTAVA
jgi:excisionase family DNA binding protein